MGGHDWIRVCRRFDLFIVYCLWYSTHDGRKAQIFFVPRRICFCVFEPLLGYYQPFPLHPYDHWSGQRRLKRERAECFICVWKMKLFFHLWCWKTIWHKKSNVNMFVRWMRLLLKPQEPWISHKIFM